MINETAFIDCKDIPEAMQGRFDQPWHFLGDVTPAGSVMQCLCGRCNPPNNMYQPNEEIADAPVQMVYLMGHLFVTDDMLEVTVYFGVCGECDKVYWARQGPPFKRARQCVGAA